MKKVIHSLLTVLILSGVFCCNSSISNKPNIIIILADDMGFSDLGCTGAEIHTPNLDRLADNGLLFTNCYNAARCWPTRASLLTGLYSHNTGIEDKGYLHNQCVTIAEVLQTAGYATIMSGKWHVGNNREHWPDKRGFENFYGIPAGGGLYFYPSKFLDRPIYRNSELVKPDSATFYSTDNITTEAIKFISEAEPSNKPFFLYLAYIAPHFPLQAWPEDIAKYEGIYDAGYETIRQNRFARQQKLQVVPPGLKLSPPEYGNWSEVNAKEESLKMAVYAAMVDRMDQNIGILINYLESIGELENTLILFLSDNGATAEGINRSPGAEIGTAYSFVGTGRNWANVSNTPYRKYKMQALEGGIITPLIAHWPTGINKGKRLVTELVHINDIMPTCLEIAGINYPEQFNGNPVLPLDGISLNPFFNNKKYNIERTIFWEHAGNSAIRVNDKKLVKSRNSPWELYDIKNDPTELNNLITREPELADSLENLWNKKAKKMGVRK
ncbi:MAG: arylsulfatase [Cyclobacteriaceae bacterium]|nr:arylsulfatase [Cyclobacteriaceae bacterium]